MLEHELPEGSHSVVQDGTIDRIIRNDGDHIIERCQATGVGYESSVNSCLIGRWLVLHNKRCGYQHLEEDMTYTCKFVRKGGDVMR